EPRIAEVSESRCTACGMCEQMCPYKAIKVIVVNERTGIKAAQVNPALCKGCGSCAAACRSGAVDVKGITDHQVNLAIKAGL
ncbi:MAG: 4Fe-4S binding protein, partial [Planctomycetes bacterium]|nr:4Fe-4S binding protein [Planctomycetota bacterium]